jgi:hypothetical protein
MLMCILTIEKTTPKRLRYLDIILNIWNLDLHLQLASICAVGCTLESFPNCLVGLDIVSECGPGVSAKSGYGLTF